MTKVDTPLRYTLSDLASRAGVSGRTVRFYIAEGLLPAPSSRGPGAHYTEGQLTRLKLIRAMQRAGNDLEIIREYLNELGDEEAKAEAALRVWENRQEQAEWAEIWRERFGAPSTLHRYRIAEGVELLVEARSAPSRERMTTILRSLRGAFTEDD